MGKRRHEDSSEGIRQKIRKLEEELQQKARRTSKRLIIYSSDSSDDDASSIESHHSNDVTPTQEDQQSADVDQLTAQRDSTPVPGPSTSSAPRDLAAASEENADKCLNDEILCILGDAPTPESKLGSEIHKDVASRWQDILCKGLAKETKDKLLKDYLVPSNCDLLLAPTLNPETKSALSENLIRRDFGLVERQKQLGIALAALSQATQMLVSNETSASKILKPVSDASRLLCDLHFQDTKTRRNFVISSVSANMKEVLTEPRTNFLFGGNVTENVRTAKSIQKSGEALKGPESEKRGQVRSSRKSLHSFEEHRESSSSSSPRCLPLALTVSAATQQSPIPPVPTRPEVVAGSPEVQIDHEVQSTRLPLPAFSPRAVLMYSAAVGGEGAVALQLREAAPGELDAARLADDRLAIACHEPELLADLLHAAADIDGEHDGLSALLGSASPDLALASDASDSLPLPDHDNDCTTSSSSSGPVSGVTTVSVAVTGLDTRPLAVKKVRPKPASPNRQGPQQCQVCNKIFGNASALAKHKLTHSDERKYVCITCQKAFKRQDHLNGHMLTHRNKKPYECKADGCGKSYCDARSLRRHTENHHQPPPPDTGPKESSSTHQGAEKEAQAHRVTSPISPTNRTNHTHSDSSSSSSEKSSGTIGACTSASGSGESPPCTPPAPVTPPARPKTTKSSSSKPKTSIAAVGMRDQTPPNSYSQLQNHLRHPKYAQRLDVRTSLSQAQQASQKSGSGASTSGAASGTSSGAGAGLPRPIEAKPVECNLCHRKFKNIPALNGHMRLHGGYFKKDSDNKKLDKKESTGPPLQTASVSVRALIEEKIISRRGATVASLPTSGSSTDSRTGFVAPAPPPLSSIRTSTSPASPAATSSHFVSPRAPPVVTVATNSASANAAHRDSTLIELLKKGNSKVVKRSASDPGQSSPQQEFTFRPELFGVSFNSDDGYFSPALNEDTFQFTATPDHLDELASLEDYATVAASIRERSPVTFPSSRRLAAVLNSPLPESLADFGACHGGSPVPSPGMGYTANSPGLSYSTGDSPGLAYTTASPGGSYSTQPEPSPGLAYPTPPASHDAHSPAHTVPRASSPLSAAFFTATMSSQEEVEEALEEVLPEECRSLDAYALEPSPAPRRIMLNSEDPLLSSSPRDFSHQRPIRRHHRILTTMPSMPWQHDTSLQVCVEGRDTVPAVFLSPSSVPASPQRRKRRASPAGPYRSRMRRSIHHFTPQPILPPDRDSSGLFIDIAAGLSTETDVLSQLEEPRLPQINIGRDHQADIPELCNDRMDLHRVPEQLLWDPGINDALDDNEVRMFMELAMCAAMPVGGHTREFALQTLGECGGDIRAATLRLMSRPAQPSQHESRWTPEEVEAFLAGLGHYDKDFYRISQLIRTKDSKQCIQFYYFWKKVTKDYKTLYLRSWHMEQASQGSVGQVPQTAAAATASPTAFDAEEFPCKICGKVFNKVKSRSAHMKSHRPLDAEPKRPKLEKPYEKVERPDVRPHSTAEYQSKPPAK